MSDQVGLRDCFGVCRPPEAVHGWFGLTYANYLVLPRSVLQSMPDEWQTRFVQCLEELDEATSEVKGLDVEYAVFVRGGDGRFKGDPVPHYNRGRTRIPVADGSLTHQEPDAP